MFSVLNVNYFFIEYRLRIYVCIGVYEEEEKTYGHFLPKHCGGLEKCEFWDHVELVQILDSSYINVRSYSNYSTYSSLSLWNRIVTVWPKWILHVQCPAYWGRMYSKSTNSFYFLWGLNRLIRNKYILDWSRASYLASLSLCFLIYEVRIILVPVIWMLWGLTEWIFIMCGKSTKQSWH